MRGEVVPYKSSQIVTERMTTEQWKKKQAKDEAISEVIKAITVGVDTHAFASEQARQMYRFRSKLVLGHGLLYKKYYDINLKEEKMQFVLPKKYWHKALDTCHDNVGHLGIERMLSVLHDRFYWPNMAQDVEIYVKSCPRCLRFKRLPERANLKSVEATRTMELVHIDYLTIEAPKNSRSLKGVNILIVTDHFTWYAHAYITPNQKANTVAKTLWDRFFVHYGFPEKILSDQGRNFESKLLEELCLLPQVKKMRITPNRLEGNGSCERFNRTLISILGTLPEEFRVEWTNHVNMLKYACNCTRSNATGFSPYYLLYGRHPLLPIDIH